jgi:glycosyltransferase involved in cell wall biosynthesis
MNIVHIVESFGAGTFDFLSELVNILKYYRHTIIHGIREDTPSNFSAYFPEGTSFYEWKHVRREVNAVDDFRAAYELYRLLDKINNIDIIHLHSSKAGFLGRFIVKIKKMENRTIFTTHAASFLREDLSILKKKLYIYLERMVHSLGAKTIACSKSEAEEFQKYKMKVDYIFNGIDCDKYEYGVNANNNKFIVGTIGRITNQKDPSLFNQIAMDFKNRQNIEFLWIGDGEKKVCLTSENIKITGWITNSEVDGLVKDIDIYLSTSRWEGLPISVLKAMSSGKPLLLKYCVGNKDLVVHNYNGYSFNTKDEAVKYIDLLIKNGESMKVFGNNSRKIVKSEFPIEKMVKQYKDLYHKYRGKDGSV